MKTIMIAAFLFAAPAAAFAQSTPDANAAPSSKVNVVVRPDMAQAEARAETHMIPPIKARSVRVAGKTIHLVDGSLPADVQSASMAQANFGS